MGLTETEMLGVDEKVLELFVQRRVALVKAGLDADAMVATLELQVAEAKTADAVQEGLKGELKAATKVATAKVRRSYITASGMLDMAMAAVDKTSDDAKLIQRIRSRVRDPESPDDSATSARPLPEPAPISR